MKKRITKEQIIVAENVTQQANDKQQAVPMLVKENTGHNPDQTSMDAGYFSETNVDSSKWSLICTTHNLLKLWKAGGWALIKPPGRPWAAC